MKQLAKNTLSKPELSRRSVLEGLITQTKESFITCGKALSEIQKSRLYRSTHKTFEAYCSDVWGWKRAHAYRLIAAAGLKDELDSSPSGRHITSEKQVRALLKVPRHKLHEVVDAAVEQGATTHEEISQVVDEIVQPELQDENGRVIPSELRETWKDADAVGSSIQSAGRSLKRLVDMYLNHDDAYKQRHNLSDQMSKDIGDLNYELSRTLPHAVCPWCEGKGCKNCHSRGWLSKPYWAQHVPKKFKKNGA